MINTKNAATKDVEEENNRSLVHRLSEDYLDHVGSEKLHSSGIQFLADREADVGSVARARSAKVSIVGMDSLV